MVLEKEKGKTSEKKGLKRGRTSFQSARQKAILNKGQREMSEEGKEQAVLVGVVSMQGDCSSERRILVGKEQSQLNVEFSEECSELGVVNTLWLKKQGLEEIRGRLLSSCSSCEAINCISGTMANYYNWT